jgi:uncharacterized Zn finger protein
MSTLNWKNFEKFQQYQNDLWVVKMEGDKRQDAICTCPFYMKNYICKHSLGIAILKCWYLVPDAAKKHSYQLEKNGSGEGQQLLRKA